MSVYMVCLRVSNQYAVDTLCKQLRMDGWKYPVSRGGRKRQCAYRPDTGI